MTTVEPDFGLQMGWCASEDELEDTRKQLHDMVIAQLGERRTGPVQWVWCDGDDALAKIETLYSPDGQEHCSDDMAKMLRTMRGLLREYGGWLVIAMAEGAPA